MLHETAPLRGATSSWRLDLLSVLLLEPHADSRDLYVAFLRHMGIRVITADTTDQALRFAETADVVVTGIRVNGVEDGLGLVRHLRAKHGSERLPIVVLTACALESDERAARDAGCDVFLKKPCLPSDLVATIQRLAADRPEPKARMARLKPGQRHHRRRA